MKPVQSRIRLDQMIGRGTRSHAACRMYDLLPDGRKNGFLVIDFWENDFNRQAEETIEQTIPVLVTIFNTRLRLLETYLGEQENEDCKRVLADLKSQVARIPRDSFTVKKVLPEIEEAWQEPFWGFLTTAKLDFLRLKVGPLLRLAPDVDVAAETFTSKVERLKLQVRKGKETSQTVQSIAEDAASLPDFVVQDAELGKLVKRCTSGALDQASMAELSLIVEKLAPQMKYKKKVSAFLTLDLKDVIELSGYILLTQSGEQVYVKEYRQRVEQRILDFVSCNPVLQAIGRGEPVDDLQLLALERDLHKTLAGSDLELSPENIRRAYGIKVESMLEFLAAVLGLDNLPDYEQIVKHQFQEFITRHQFGADPVRFLRAVQSVFIQKRRLALADLYQEPLSNFGVNAVDRWFTPKEVDEILVFTQRLVI
jgi:type I restriction enzyme R subunit